jgi:hypothetical protein
MSLKNKVAIVTGGSSGIGQAIVPRTGPASCHNRDQGLLGVPRQGGQRVWLILCELQSGRFLDFKSAIGIAQRLALPMPVSCILLWCSRR